MTDKTVELAGWYRGTFQVLTEADGANKPMLCEVEGWVRDPFGMFLMGAPDGGVVPCLIALKSGLCLGAFGCVHVAADAASLIERMVDWSTLDVAGLERASPRMRAAYDALFERVPYKAAGIRVWAYRNVHVAAGHA